MFPHLFQGRGEQGHQLAQVEGLRGGEELVPEAAAQLIAVPQVPML